MNQLAQNIELQEECERLYSTGLSISSVALQTNLDRNTVFRHLKSKALTRTYTESQVLRRVGTGLSTEIQDRYLNGESSLEIASSLGIGDNAALAELNRLGIARDHAEAYLTRNRRNLENYDFFDVIDTEWKAYWLGFICADGCVYEKDHRVSLDLAEQDVEHLELFANVFKRRVRIQQVNIPTYRHIKIKLHSEYPLQTCTRLS